MQSVQNLIKTILEKLNFLDHEQRLSLSNITVAVFVLISAIRMLFGGSTLQIGGFSWSIQTIDIAGTLPVLYSLLNYSHKRQIIDSAKQTESKGNE